MNYLIFVLSFAFCIIGLFFWLTLLFYNKSYKYSKKLIVLGLFSIIITVYFNSLLHIQGFYIRYPYLWRLGVFAQYLSAPSFFLYVKASLNNEQKIHKLDLIHFMPAFLHFLEFVPFYLIPIDVKKVYLTFLFSHPERLFQQTEGILPANFHLILKLGLAIIYQIFQFRLLVVYRIANKGMSKSKLVFWKWLVWFTVFFSMTLLYFILLFVFCPSVVFAEFSVFGFLFFLSALVIMLLFNPMFLYGFQNHLVVDYEGGVNENKENELLNSSRFLTADKAKFYKEKLDGFICSEKSFLRRDYSIRQLALDCQITVHDLSVLINQEYGCNYNHFINRCRVNYIIVHRFDEKWKHYTLEAIGFESGFNSRSSFFKAFKKLMKVSPKVFFEQYYKEDFLNVATLDEGKEECEFVKDLSQ